MWLSSHMSSSLSSWQNTLKMAKGPLRAAKVKLTIVFYKPALSIDILCMYCCSWCVMMATKQTKKEKEKEEKRKQWRRPPPKDNVSNFSLRNSKLNFFRLENQKTGPKHLEGHKGPWQEANSHCGAAIASCASSAFSSWTDLLPPPHLGESRMTVAGDSHVMGLWKNWGLQQKWEINMSHQQKSEYWLTLGMQLMMDADGNSREANTHSGVGEKWGIPIPARSVYIYIYILIEEIDQITRTSGHTQ